MTNSTILVEHEEIEAVGILDKLRQHHSTDYIASEFRIVSPEKKSWRTHTLPFPQRIPEYFVGLPVILKKYHVTKETPTTHIFYGKEYPAMRYNGNWVHELTELIDGKTVTSIGFPFENHVIALGSKTTSGILDTLCWEEYGPSKVNIILPTGEAKELELFEKGDYSSLRDMKGEVITIEDTLTYHIGDFDPWMWYGTQTIYRKSEQHLIFTQGWTDFAFDRRILNRYSPE